MIENYNNSPRATRRAIEGQKVDEEKIFQRRIKKLYNHRTVLKASDAFMRVVPELISLGWIYEEDFLNYVELPDYSERMTESLAIRLVTEKFNITLIPHGNGIEISRLEVWEKYQGKGYAGLFLNNILPFFETKGVSEIYVLPLPAGIGKSQNSLAYNINALQEFYRRRGFEKMENSYYWKLNIRNAADTHKY